MNDASTSSLFSDVKFVIAECQDADSTKNLLIDNGAKHINYLSEHVTLVVSDFACLEADEALNIFEKPVVSSLWVHLSLKAGRLLPPEAFCPYKNIFRNVVAAFSADLTRKDINVLACTLTYYGARVSKNVGTSTHFIVPKSNPRDLPTENICTRLVAPDWVFESIRQNSPCDEKLFEPSLLLPPPPPPPPPQPQPPPPPAQPQEDPQKSITPIESNDVNKGPVFNSTDTTKQQTCQITQSHQPAQPRSPQVVQISQPPRPTLSANIIRPKQPRFRSILPPNSDNSPQPYQPRSLGSDQHVKRVTINYGQPRKVAPYHNQMEQQPGQQQPMSNQPQVTSYVPDQQHVIIQHSAPNMQPRMSQPPPVYHQIQGPYQGNQTANREGPPQPMTVRHHAQQPTVINRFQDPNIQQPQRPYQVQIQPPHQNQQYQQSSNVPRQAGYYPQNQSQMTMRVPQQGQPIRHVQPDQITYDNSFNQTNHRRPEYIGNQTHYQPHPRVQQPYAPTPQQSQPQHIRSPLHHQPLPHQHQHVSPDRIQPELQSHIQPQQHMQVQNRPLVSVQSHPQSQIQPQHPVPPQIQLQPQQQPMLGQQSQSKPQQQPQLQHQQLHQHGHPSQSIVQLRPQSQPVPSNPNQVIRSQSIAPNHHVEQKVNNTRPNHPPQVIPPQMGSSRGPPPEECSQPQPHPSIFDHAHESNLAQIRSKVPIVNESVRYFGHDPRQTVPKDQPLFGCKFKQVEYKDVDPSLKAAWSKAVRDAGGIYCNDLAEATHLVCETRKSDDYLRAVQLGIRCVTIYWINDVLASNRLTHPWKALHLPIAFGMNEKPLTDQIITVTNFRGKERREMKEMILKTGAHYTEYFSPKNTLVICGTVGGDKYDKAIELKVPIANRQILNDILLFGEGDIGQLLTQSKYQNFSRGEPPRLSSNPKMRELLKSWTRPIPLVELKDTHEQPKMNGNSKESVPLDPSSIAKESHSVDADVKINGTDSIVTVKLETERLDSISQKNLNSSDKSTTIDPDPSLVLDSIKMTVETEKSQNLESACSHEVVVQEGGEKPPCLSKQFRKSQEPVRLLYTNVRSDLIEPLKNAAAQLGVSFASTPKECTHLLIGRLCRTTKFVCAFNHASYFITPDWLIESSAAGGLLDERPFIVQDREGEEKYSFNLVYSLVKRKRRSDLLFSNWVFFVTPSIRKVVPNMEEIIESAGGCVCTRRLPNKKQLEQLKSEGKRMVAITCDEDYHLCSSLESYGTDVVTPEFVISGILRQDIDFDVHRVRKRPRLEYT